MIYEPAPFTEEDERLTVIRILQGVGSALMLTAAIVGPCVAILAWFG